MNRVLHMVNLLGVGMRECLLIVKEATDRPKREDNSIFESYDYIVR